MVCAVPNRRKAEDAELEALYARVPDIGCRGLCTDACGPVEAGPRERERLAAAGVRLPEHAKAVMKMVTTPGLYKCPALVNGRCGAYEARPMICRVWGASLDLLCPYGCRPVDGERLLRSADTLALVDAATKVGTGEEPMSAESFEERLRDPARRRIFEMFKPSQPTETVRPAPGLIRKPPKR